MKRLLLALGLALFAMVPVAAQQMSGSESVTGDWKVQATGDQFIAGNLHLSQVGHTVVGSAIAANSKGTGVLQISGQLNGSTVSGKWRSPTGNVGWITLHLHGMSSFNGEWGYGGRSANGSIVAQKIRTTAF